MLVKILEKNKDPELQKDLEELADVIEQDNNRIRYLARNIERLTKHL